MLSYTSATTAGQLNRLSYKLQFIASIKDQPNMVFAYYWLLKGWSAKRARAHLHNLFDISPLRSRRAITKVLSKARAWGFEVTFADEEASSLSGCYENE